MGGVTFSSPQLEGAVSSSYGPNMDAYGDGSIPSMATSYAFDPANTNNFGIYASVGWDATCCGGGVITPYISLPQGPFITCTPLPASTFTGSIDCPLPVTSYQPGTALIAFSSTVNGYLTQLGAYAFSIAGPPTVIVTATAPTSSVTGPVTYAATSTVTTARETVSSVSVNYATITIQSTATAQGTCLTPTPSPPSAAASSSFVNTDGGSSAVPSSISTAATDLSSSSSSVPSPSESTPSTSAAATTTSTYSSFTTLTTFQSSFTRSSTLVTPTTTLVCNADNCLRALQESSAAAQSFCYGYTSGATSTTPTFVPAECTPSRLSSACTCFAISPGGSTSTSTTSTTSSTTSSNPTTAKTTSTSSTTAKTTSTSTTSTTSQLVCNGDNCLNALRNSQSSALAYCNTYTMGATSTTPTWVPAECTPSRLSSACTCVVASPTSATSSIPAVTKRAGAGFFGMQFAEATTLAKRDNGYVGPDYTLSNGAVAPFYSSTSTSTTTVTPTTTLPGSIGGTTTSTTTINTMTIIVTSSSTVTSTNTVTVTAVPAECAAAATSGMSTAVSTGL